MTSITKKNLEFICDFNNTKTTIIMHTFQNKNSKILFIIRIKRLIFYLENIVICISFIYIHSRKKK